MIRAIMIVEMAGLPPAHVKDTLTKHVNVLTKFKDIKVNQITVSEPKELTDSKGVYTCFAEVDFETETFARLSDSVFDFMPSSIEVLEPSKITFNLQESSSILNNIAGKMHRYDEFARMAKYKMDLMQRELQQLKGTKPAEERKEEEEKVTTKEEPKQETSDNSKDSDKKSKKKK